LKNPPSHFRNPTDISQVLSRPKLLDLFCCAGGAGMGYSRAGFDVVGVDLDRQLNYPFAFRQDDALQAMRDLLSGAWLRFREGDEILKLTLSDFDAIHASPPCQGYTALKAVHGNEWPLLIEPVRELLDQTGLPYVIENVQGAPVRRDLTLCGEMFWLKVIRHRFFELGGWTATQPAHVPHRGRVAGWRHGKFYDGPYFAVYGNGGGKGTVAQWQDALGIDWTTDRRELAEAIPPMYTEFIGAQLIKAFEVADGTV
jgi:DNA (cytosine-5)-methyltransferase 1